MDTNMNTNHLDWLPSRMPQQCAFIIGTSDDKSHIPTECRLEDRCPLKYTINALNTDDQKTICREYMQSYGKALDDEQLSALIKTNKQSSATWLRLALDETRIFGNFRAVTQYILSMPTNTNALITKCIKRIVADDSDSRPCERALCLMKLDTHPPTVHKLRTLLGKDDMSEMQPAFNYVTMMSVLDAFVREMADGRLIFRYEHMNKVRVC
jgi:hypothetical protein